MANIISISVSPENLEYLKKNKVKKSELFSDAIVMHRGLEDFLDLHRIFDWASSHHDLLRKIGVLQKEIVRRNETIEALQDVLAKKEVEQRRI